MEKWRTKEGKRKKRCFVGTAAFCVFFFGDVAALNLETGEAKKAVEVEKRAAGVWLTGGGGGNGRILATPASATRLNVRELRPGDILAARWEEEERNGTPGFWNHLAIVGANGDCVVEAQKSADGIVTAPINGFLARYSDVCVVRFFDSKTARRAAVWAESRVAVEGKSTPPLRPPQTGNAEMAEMGNLSENVEFNGWGKEENGEKTGKREEGKTRLSGPRYSWSASLTPILRDDAATENCVSLVRRAFWKAAGVDYRWKTPDDLARWDKSGDFAKIGRF
ncbi:MAG: hypothetical protein J6K25_11100 [Thermoguttaceae bacterium]|nr:hypothetical protein [Thermoguttaceae bacterium]